MHTTVPLILNWTSEVISQPARKRSIAIALVKSFSNTSPIYGSFLWPSPERPHNSKGFAVTTAVLWHGVLVAALMPVIARYLPKSQSDEPRPRHEKHIADNGKLVNGMSNLGRTERHTRRYQMPSKAAMVRDIL
jgi:hypothetical protein